MGRAHRNWGEKTGSGVRRAAGRRHFDVSANVRNDDQTSADLAIGVVGAIEAAFAEINAETTEAPDDFIGQLDRRANVRGRGSDCRGRRGGGGGSGRKGNRTEKKGGEKETPEAGTLHSGVGHNTLPSQAAQRGFAPRLVEEWRQSSMTNKCIRLSLTQRSGRVKSCSLFPFFGRVLKKTLWPIRGRLCGGKMGASVGPRGLWWDFPRRRLADTGGVRQAGGCRR